jgi:hypothetical protein
MTTIDVTLVGEEQPTPVTLRRYFAGERNAAIREAMKITGSLSKVGALSRDGSGIAGSPTIDIDPMTLRELKLVASINSPVNLKTLEDVRTKLYPEDFDRLAEAAEALNEPNPSSSQPSVSQ